MRIKHLKLLNFRNHKKTEIDFGKTNIILGPNGSGKTSILESIFLVSTSKSPRTARNTDLINWCKKKALIEIEAVDNRNRESVYRLLLSKPKNGKNKIFSINGVIVEPRDVVGQIKTVYFSPEMLEIISGDPATRRRFIDILLSQTNQSYLIDLIEYKKILLNRNKLLKEIAVNFKKKDELVFWDMKLVEVGSRIMRARKKAVISLSKPLNKYHKLILEKYNKGNNIKIKYHPSFALDGNKEEIENLYTLKIAQELDLEIRYGSTLYGPHRDELKFLYLNHEVSDFCSRGEIRSIIIALKLAEVEYIKKAEGDFPIILFDDIFSELDNKRILKLSDYFKKDYQSIISTVEPNVVKKLSDKNKKLIKLSKSKAHV